MKTREIVVVLTNKGYVAIEGNQIFDLWKNKSLKVVYEELHERYPKYKVHLGSMDKIQFQQAVDVSQHYLCDHNELRFVQSENIKYKINNPMKKSSFNSETVVAIAKVTAGFTTQKVLGTIHLTLQSGSDILQSSANKVAKGEASILSRMDIYNESKKKLVSIRKKRTKSIQKSIKNTPHKIMKTSANIIGDMRNLFKNKVTVNQSL